MAHIFSDGNAASSRRMEGGSRNPHDLFRRFGGTVTALLALSGCDPDHRRTVVEWSPFERWLRCGDGFAFLPKPIA